ADGSNSTAMRVHNASSVTDSEPVAGRLRSRSRLPQYLTSAMFGCAWATIRPVRYGIQRPPGAFWRGTPGAHPGGRGGGAANSGRGGLRGGPSWQGTRARMAVPEKGARGMPGQCGAISRAGIIAHGGAESV